MGDPAGLTALPHAPWWAVLASALLALAAFVNHVRFRRSGPDGPSSRRPCTAGIPAPRRDLHSAQLPGGVMFAIWAVFLAYTHVSGHVLLDALMLLAALASLWPGALAAKRLHHPPDPPGPARPGEKARHPTDG
ncbi:hypothetical protein [Bailinhaonella thermotolerans]|uniref:Uncharacterized protein n=1 Tax=Bailinhaonella thermotolerans TaxID=1070861 RepID=A0A3A4AWQ3_9ACTN|nr:hypothetical protein [Bailinhaonella thermotolerans]RJL34365.1 hypothetical protein D5H75_07955 [Bailinhaonella thermotolerans]